MGSYGMVGIAHKVPPDIPLNTRIPVLALHHIDIIP